MTTIQLGIVAYDRVHPELLEAIASGKIKGIEELITRRVALEDLVEQGLLTLLNDRDSHGMSRTYVLITILTMPLSSENSYSSVITGSRAGLVLLNMFVYYRIGTVWRKSCFAANTPFTPEAVITILARQND